MLIRVVEILTAIAGSAMSIGHFFQAYRIWKRKSAKDLSWYMYGMFTAGAYIWLLYGILLNEWAIYVPFIIAVIGTTTVMALMLRYR